MIYVLKIIWDYWGAAIETYRPQYRSLSAIRYLDANPLPTCDTLFSTLPPRRVRDHIFLPRRSYLAAGLCRAAHVPHDAAPRSYLDAATRCGVGKHLMVQIILVLFFCSIGR
jgi:hypothetical protein